MSDRINAKVVAGIVAVLMMVSAGIAVAEDKPAAATDDTWAKIAKYETGQSRTDLSIIEEEIRVTPVAQYGKYEDKLLVLIKTPGATYEAKDFACRMLRIVGSTKCLPAIEELLQDEKLSSMARYAVEGMAAPEVDKMFRAALSKVKGGNKAGVISSIAARADKGSVSLLEPLVTDGDVNVARGAIAALGAIGTPDALKVLSKAQVAANLKDVRMEACLRCADGMLAKGDNKKAAAVYREMMAEGNSRGIRAAAIVGLAKAEKENAIPALISLLKGNDAVCQRVAGKALMEIKGEKTASAVLSEMGSMSADAQNIAMNVLMACESRSAVVYVAKMKMTEENEKAVKMSVKALGQLGNLSDFELLAGLVKGGGDLGSVAVDSICRLAGKGVSEAVIKLLPSVEAPVRAKLIENLGDRQSSAAFSELLKYVDDPAEPVKAAAMKSLGQLAGEKDIPALVKMLLSTKAGSVQAAAEKAVQTACLKIRSKDKAVEPLVAAVAGASAEGRVVLMRCLGKIGGVKSLEAVKNGLKDADESVKESAVRSLADWPDDGAIQDVLDLAKNAPKDNLKILAFRGYVRLASISAKKKGAEAAKLLSDALTVSVPAGERKLVFGALGNIRDAAAFDVAQKYIQDEVLATEAELACINITKHLKGKARENAMVVIKKIAETSKSEGNRKQAEEAAKK